MIGPNSYAASPIYGRKYKCSKHNVCRNNRRRKGSVRANNKIHCGASAIKQRLHYQQRRELQEMRDVDTAIGRPFIKSVFGKQQTGRRHAVA